jgi:hypothetical protein
MPVEFAGAVISIAQRVSSSRLFLLMANDLRAALDGG